MKKKVVITCFVLFVILGIFVFTIVRDAGEFRELKPHADCRCTKVPNVLGSEDIAIDHSTGTAYISGSDFRSLMKGKFCQGHLYSYTLEGKPVLTNLTAGLKMPFAPHGISLYTAPDNRKYLFAVSHPFPRNCIEIFEITDRGLIHRETIENEFIVSPNDIAAVGPRQFYFTNDHGLRSDLGRMMEDYLRLSRANIVYYDGVRMRVVADGLKYANGVWATGDGKYVYAAASTGKAFYKFERDAGGDLRLLHKLDVNSGVDNIDVDAQGRILIGSHPKLLTFVQHAGNPQKRSPSQVLEVFANQEGGYAFRELYLSDGSDLSACTVAAGYKKRLLLGAVFEGHFLDCHCEK